MRRKLPHIDFTEFAKDPRLGQVGNIFTVAVLVKYIERKLGAGAPA
jgi:hypothetical protein